MPKKYDLIVIGAGPGGYVAAIRAAQLGLHVACVDKNPRLGGTCLNIGCIPSKALLDSTHFLKQAKDDFAKHGIQAKDVGVDLKKMMARKNDVVQTLTKGVAHLLKKNKVEVFDGKAALESTGKVSISGKKKQTIEAKFILLATGSTPAELPNVPFDGEQVVTSTEALSFDEVPQHLLVIGAGYIGLELGSVWARLGAKVTVLEFLPHILGPSDREVAGALAKKLKQQGLEIRLKTKVTGVDKHKSKVVLKAEQDGNETEFSGDKVLVAVGRRPLTRNLGLKETGIKLDEKTGQIKVDKQWQTTAGGVYAIGDLIHGPALAHKAMAEGVAVAERLAGKAGAVNYDAIPSVVYTDPELASVGLTEEQANEKDRDYKVGKFSFTASGRARCLGQTDGMIKVITDAKTDELLGAHLLGPHASELLPEFVLAMEYKGTAEDIARTCHAHPTLAEAINEASRAAWDAAIHG